ncbi:MAG: hypothetical protein EXR67_06515 [Dehalococcoidia bacterium]|nr:hypothetical protein [Dehalococcoidia bacterium]
MLRAASRHFQKDSQSLAEGRSNPGLEVHQEHHSKTNTATRVPAKTNDSTAPVRANPSKTVSAVIS